MSNLFYKNTGATGGIVRSRGAALLIVTVLAMLGSLVVALGIARTVYQDILRHRELTFSKQAFYAMEAGVEDAVHRLRNGKTISNTETLTLGDATITTNVITTLNEKEVAAEGNMFGRIRKTGAILEIGNGASFNFGLQSGNGGIDLYQQSEVLGNVYSDGPVRGYSTNLIRGDVVSAGPSGLITGIHATGSAYSHNITASTIDGNVYYAGGVAPPPGVTVVGTTFTNMPDQPSQEFPISDDLIDDQKAIAEAGGVINDTNGCVSGKYTIDSSMTIGPIKIDCNLVVEKKGGGTTVTLLGPVWVSGNIDTKSGPTFAVDASLGSGSVALIADNETDRTTSSKIVFDQSGATFNSPTGNSYVLAISQNNSAENSGNEIAIAAQQSLSGKILLYASHGMIELSNSASLKEVTGYRIVLRNTAQVQYESGLASVLFGGGPGGGYSITSWNETE